MLAMVAFSTGTACVSAPRADPEASEKRYLRGMADLGEGPFASTAIADHIGRKPSSFGPVRASLIAKGMIYTPGYGETAFTVPMFGAFMRRAMPVADGAAGQGE